MDALTEEGIVILGGPVGEGDGEDVLLVVDVESEAAIRARLADDPWGTDMLTIESVEPWSVWLRAADAPIPQQGPDLLTARLRQPLATPLVGTPPAADEAYSVGAVADGSCCQRPNSLPCVSLQVANQPMPGTGSGSSASPPSSFTRAAPALTSSTLK